MMKNTLKEKIIKIIIKVGLIFGIITIFYKLPELIADKISYQKIKNTPVSQKITEEEE